jgi:acyl-CoA synthetase (AMP-forming)/AMP-acid ligase II
MNVFDYFFKSTASIDKDLIIGPREQISYAEIYYKSLRLANQLNSSFGENKKIFLISENSSFFIIAYLGILKSGNICVPLNPNIEAGIFKGILNSVKSKLAFIGKRHLNRFEQFDLKIFDIDFDDPIGIKNNIEDVFDENRTAEIIFTSGSTGEQKGVMITHKNIIANTNSIIQYLRLSSKDIIQVVMPFYYCYGLSLLHTHLRVGGSLVLNNSFIFLGSVINDLKKYKCTGFSGVPSHFQILLRKTKDFITTDFPDLKYVTQAGGKLHTAFISEFIKAFPKVKFYVMYGQTEATARLSYLEPDRLADKLGSIGKGIPDVELKVVDQNGTEINPGENGEIIAKGSNVMAGYYLDEKGTAEAIRDEWLYTGDMATVDEEGFIYIQSRKKEIIKVRGIRISPKEIEEIIVTYPGVIDCTIQAISDEITGEAIKAIIYINEAERGNFTPEIIMNHCACHLGQQKVPKIVEFESKLAFNASGKKTKH